MLLILFGAIIIIFAQKNFVIIFYAFLLVFFLLSKKDKKKILLLSFGLIFGFLSINNNQPYPEDNSSFIGIVYQRKSNYFLFNCEEKNYYVYLVNHQYESFDRLEIKGISKNISFACLESQFNFQEYLYNKKVEKEIVVESIKEIYLNPIRKTLIKEQILSSYDGNTKMMMNLLFFNDSDNEFSQQLYKLDFGSYFTLSGLQIYFLFSFFYKILLFFTNKKRLSYNLSIGFLLPFLIFSNYKLSFIKALLIIINNAFSNKKITSQQVVSVFLMLIIFINYRFVFTTSFIYIFVLPFIFKRSFFLLKPFIKKEKNALNSFYFSLLIGVVNLYQNGKYNLLSGIVFPLFIQVSRIYLILGILSFIIPLTKVINIFSSFIVKFIKILDEVPMILYLKEKQILLFIFLIIIVFLIWYFVKLRLKKLALSSILAYYLIVLVFSLGIETKFTQYVTFINVGQGDCALIHNQNHNILIDTGGSLYIDIANEVVLPYLKKNHITSIDCLFISHNDYDHSGAYENLKKSLEIKQTIVGSNFYTKEIGNITFYNLNQYEVGTEENNNSSVIYFSFIKRNFLFMGDAPKEIERKIMINNPNLKADIIKLGHHGSSTSSDYRFLKNLSLKEAVISVGLNNIYYHPHQIVLQYLNDLKIKIRRTDYEGSIIYT